MTIRRFSIRASPMAAALALLSAVGCTKDRDVVTAPRAPAANAAAVSATPAGAAFYYYYGQPILLDVDSSRLVVSSTLQAPQAAIGEALSGLPPTGVERLPQLLDHWTVHLPRSTPQAYGAALARLRADGRFGFVSEVFRSRVDGSPVVLVNRLLVSFKAGASQVEKDSLLRSLGMKVVREPKPDSGFLWHLVTYPVSAAPLAVAADLYHNPLVNWVEPDMFSNFHVMEAPSDPYYSLQYYLKNTVYLNGVRVDNNVEPAWDLTHGAGVKVAIVDYGIDATHADLCAVQGAGYDTYNYPGEDAWHPYRDSTADVHGTAISGIIAACHSNGMGIAGIAPAVTLLAVRVCRNGRCNDNDHFAAAVNWAWSTGQADVLSNSWGGGDYSQPLTDAINSAATQGRGGKGAAVVFSAGNPSNREGIGTCGSSICPVLYPATLSSVLSVGAIDRNGYLTNYTPEGPHISLVAPSGHYTSLCNDPFHNHGDVVTFDFWGPRGCNDGPNSDVNYTSRFSGTSAAAPQVAAAAALLFSMYPAMGWGDAANRIANNADYWGPSYQYGSGKLNIYRILVPLLGAYIYGAFPSYSAATTGGVAPYSYYWEFCITNCGGAAPAPPPAGKSPNRPIQGWQFLSTSQTVSWGTHQSYLRCTVTDFYNQQAQAQIYVQ